MSILWLLTILTLIGALLFALSIAIGMRRCLVLHPSDQAPADAPLISVVLPARNEAANIERCVRSLLAQNYPHLEVVVVDDSSTDATPQILARLARDDERLYVVHNSQLPPGWTGKNNAVYVGAQHAHGDWLLFVDADVYVHPGALSAAYSLSAARGVTMLSLWARQELVSFWERVIQPVLIGMNLSIDPFQRVSNPLCPKTASANGQFILVERQAYERVGGHMAVRSEVLEDQELARLLKRSGEPILMVDGTEVLSTRMYTSLAGVWEGWSKNNFLTLQRNPLMLLGAILAVFFVNVSPFLMALAIPLAGFKFSYQVLDPLMVNLVAIFLILMTRWRASGHFATPLRYYVWHALGGLMFIGIMLNSAYRYMGGHGVTWKGRTYGEADVA